MDRVVALADVVDQQLQMLLRQFGQHRGTNRARSVAAQRGFQHPRSHLYVSDGPDGFDRQTRILARQRMALRITDQHLRQRADLHGLTVKARRLDPGVLLIAIPAGKGGLRLSDPGVKRLFTAIVGVRYIFADAIAKILVGCGLERVHAADIPVHECNRREDRRMSPRCPRADRGPPGSC